MITLNACRVTRNAAEDETTSVSTLVTSDTEDWLVDGKFESESSQLEANVLISRPEPIASPSG
jgi:hypothetical protein